MKCGVGSAEWGVGTERPDGNNAGGRVLVTRVGLAVALGVSLRTVDRMVAAGDVAPVRVRGWLVRFYVPDVIECLKREQNKFGRRAGEDTETGRRGGADNADGKSRPPNSSGIDTNFTNYHERGRTADRRG